MPIAFVDQQLNDNSREVDLILAKAASSCCRTTVKSGSSSRPFLFPNRSWQTPCKILSKSIDFLKDFVDKIRFTRTWKWDAHHLCWWATHWQRPWVRRHFSESCFILSTIDSKKFVERTPFLSIVFIGGLVLQKWPTNSGTQVTK